MAARSRSEKPNQKPGSMITTSVRAAALKGDIPRSVIPGLSDTYLHSQSVRNTEVQALELSESKHPYMSDLQLTIRHYYLQGGRTKVDKRNGKTTFIALYGRALLDWVAGQVRANGFPAVNVHSVIAELENIDTIMSMQEQLRIA